MLPTGSSFFSLYIIYALYKTWHTSCRTRTVPWMWRKVNQQKNEARSIYKALSSSFCPWTQLYCYFQRVGWVLFIKIVSPHIFLLTTGTKTQPCRKGDTLMLNTHFRFISLFELMFHRQVTVFRNWDNSGNKSTFAKIYIIVKMKNTTG